MRFEIMTTGKNFVMNLFLIGLLTWLYMNLNYDSLVGSVTVCVLIVLFGLYIALQHIAMIFSTNDIRSISVRKYLETFEGNHSLGNRISVDELYKFGYIELHKLFNTGNLTIYIVLIIITALVSFI